MRNRDAHLLVPLTLTVVDRSGGATARCGGEQHGKWQQRNRAPQQTIQRVPEHLGATRDSPEWSGGTGNDGAVLATKSRAGAGDDDVENLPWTK